MKHLKIVDMQFFNNFYYENIIYPIIYLYKALVYKNFLARQIKKYLFERQKIKNDLYFRFIVFYTFLHIVGSLKILCLM